MAVLDLGVGGGRTTLNLAPRCAEYVGIEYSAALLEACRRRVDEHDWSHVSLELGDARDLSRFPDDRFDFTFFSWNGIDVVGSNEDRRRSLREMLRVTKPGGWASFSGHNLQWLPVVTAPKRHPKRMAKAVVLRFLNRKVRDEDPWAIVADERHGFRWEYHFYIRPAAQLAELRELGFRDPVVLDAAGAEVPESVLRRLTEHWVYYVCRT
jgi:ubiquinone/menaquinone biosynthesis C-methylase UbiE